MKLNALSLTMGIALAALGGLPAQAGDWHHGAGGLKGSIPEAVPVPAPVPIPEYAARYYFRADAGFGFGDAPDAREQGMVYGYDSRDGRFPMDPAWLNADFETFVTLGLGVGMYVGNNWRLDMTAETRSQAKVKYKGDYHYYTEANNAGDYREVRGEVDDETTLRGGIFLFNGYYEFDRSPMAGFRPYIGAGIGFAWNELKRNHSTVDYVRDCDNANGCNGAYTRRNGLAQQDKTHDMTFAAQATVGASYKMNDWTHLDLNYRFLYIDGASVGFGMYGNSIGGESGVTIDATHEHQVRAGLRFDVN